MSLSLKGGAETRTMLRTYLLAFDQTYVLVVKDFKLKYNSTALGFIWSTVTPVAQSLVYYFVFKVIMRFQMENYLLYLLSGMFLWQFFCNCLTVSAGTFLSNASLLKKTAFPREYLVIGALMTELLHFILTIPILLALMAFYGVMPGASLLTLPIVLVNFMLFSLGLAFAIASLNMYFRDLERMLAIALQIWFFLSPIFIPISEIPPKYQTLIMLNPMTSIINAWRDIFFQPSLHLSNIVISSIFAVISLIAGYLIFRWKEPRFAEMI